jgi:hypothetical protein
LKTRNESGWIALRQPAAGLEINCHSLDKIGLIQVVSLRQTDFCLLAQSRINILQAIVKKNFTFSQRKRSQFYMARQFPENGTGQPFS